MSKEVAADRGGSTRYRFGGFVLDVPDRQLWRGDTRVDLNARYLDALVLLVREAGRLVGKDRFFEEVWRDVVVSDSALSQCIREIRRQLGDDASHPRFVQTVPGHGYRFIAVVEPDVGGPPGGAGVRRASEGTWSWRVPVGEVGAGTLGGASAGALGGLVYGFGLASADAGVGTLSTLLVLVSLTVLAGLIGGFGVSLGLAGGGVAARRLPALRVPLRVAGAALGGLVVGATAKLLGVDAFNLLFGRAPAGITGGPEGAALGAALALGAHLGHRFGGRAAGKAVAGAALAGALAGAVIPLVGGSLMGGSLDLLAQSFTESRLALDRFALLFGEAHFGRTIQVVLGAVEGLFFGAGVVGALVVLGRRRQDGNAGWRP